ncbi:MAG TPA: hypothetical protein VD867_11025 [Burkholderiales bacterium]|nr:hypothetical protein [Burkholderiales bacterium]
MHCTLLIPHLFWPRENAEAILRGLELPALTKLLARARAERFPAITPEGWLCGAFEVERQHDWPLAALTLELDGVDPGEAYWLRADPVHIKVERDRLSVVDSALFDITDEEARAFVEALDRHFAADGLSFVSPRAKHWYVKVARAPDLLTRSIREVAGADVRPNLPAGADALRWHRVFNESQMLLHAHPANAAREERGEPVVNSIWPWGGGTRAAVRGRPFDHVWSNDASASALAVAAGAHAAPLPASAEALFAQAASDTHSGSHLLVLDTLSSAMAYQDMDAWRERLAAFEARWFAPLMAALGRGRISATAIVVPGEEACCRFDTARADLYKLWRTVKPLAAYA